MCKMLLCVLVLVIFVSSPAVTKVTKDETASCRANQKQCMDGSCVPINARCNQIWMPHNNTHENPRVRRQAKPLISSNKCVLPPYPEHGTYEVSNVPNTSPGQQFESFVLKITCRRGYGFMETESGIDDFDILQIYCINGRWFQRMPKCVRFCKLDPHPSVRYMCHVPGVGFRACHKYLPPGTSVNPICKAPLYTSSKDLPFMKCVSGYWDYIAECQAECGQVTSEGEQLVIGGELAKRGELPWHVGVYRKNTVPYIQICGATLVSNSVVISAAHCFWDDVSMQQPASDFAVATGKLHRPWNSKKDVDVQKSNVKEIKMPVLFYGASTNFQEDIATVILETPFEYKTYVRPVCLHFDLNFERRQLQSGKFGKVAGWGLTSANGKSSPVLKVVQLPYISLATCLKTVPKQFREYLTADKFCAGYDNGTALCRGDSGGGLSFAALTELDIERYYLRGVVSAAPTSDDLCNANTFTAFTKISKHEEFIKDALARADKNCPPYLFRCNDGECVYQGADCNGKKDCKDGSDESDWICKPGYVINATEIPKAKCVLPPFPAHGSYKVTKPPNARPGESVETFVLSVSCDGGNDMVDSNGEMNGTQSISCANGEWNQEMPKCALTCGRVTAEGALQLMDGQSKRRDLPWHVGIYMKAPSYLQICGGTLVSNKVVISAATCFDEDKRISPSKYAVAAGKLYGRWDDTNDVDTQKSNVKEINISSLSISSKSKIAALFLVSPFVYTGAVRPVCINLDPDFDAQHQDRLGKTATWPFEAEQQHPFKLRRMESVELSNNLDICNSFIEAAQEENICAAYTKDPRLFAVFAGSGLVYADNDGGLEHYYLRGIMSNVLVCGNGCMDSDYNYHVYTRLSDYKEFVLNTLK